jgi:5-methyltetrahydropteroyltriglutamate--homocysteine methyltransferase
MKLPTEPIGSIPRPPELIEAIKANAAGKLNQDELDAFYRELAFAKIKARVEGTRLAEEVLG